jgi:hypothetical protein
MSVIVHGGHRLDQRRRQDFWPPSQQLYLASAPAPEYIYAGTGTIAGLLEGDKG